VARIAYRTAAFFFDDSADTFGFRQKQEVLSFETLDDD